MQLVDKVSFETYFGKIGETNSPKIILKFFDRTFQDFFFNQEQKKTILSVKAQSLTSLQEKLLVSGSQAARRHAILVIWLVYIASYFSQ